MDGWRLVHTALRIRAGTEYRDTMQCDVVVKRVRRGAIKVTASVSASRHGKYGQHWSERLPVPGNVPYMVNQLVPADGEAPRSTLSESMHVGGGGSPGSEEVGRSSRKAWQKEEFKGLWSSDGKGYGKKGSQESRKKYSQQQCYREGEARSREASRPRSKEERERNPSG